MKSFIEDMVDGYLQCMLWAENDESTPDGGIALDQTYSVREISDRSWADAYADCAEFVSLNYDLVHKVWQSEEGRNYVASHFGHDFWLTRTGHGAGFWSRDLGDGAGDLLTEACKAFPHVDAVVGDDHLIYTEPSREFWKKHAR